MSNTSKATGRRDATAGEQLATMRDVDELFTIRLAAYHEAHIYEMRKWIWWRNLPWYRRAWLTMKSYFIKIGEWFKREKDTGEDR